MPVTFFHFGPGTLLKACAPRAVSLTAFVLSQAVIDIESGYHLLRHEWPIHREVHSMSASALAGVVTGTATFLLGRALKPSNNAAIQAEVNLLPAFIGGLVGGLSHSLLDAIMHADVKPFWPVSLENPFLDFVNVAALHTFCVVTGVIGAVVLAIRLLIAHRAQPF